MHCSLGAFILFDLLIHRQSKFTMGAVGLLYCVLYSVGLPHQRDGAQWCKCGTLERGSILWQYSLCHFYYSVGRPAHHTACTWRPCLFHALFSCNRNHSKISYIPGFLEHHHLVPEPSRSLSRRRIATRLVGICKQADWTGRCKYHSDGVSATEMVETALWNYFAC